MRNMTETSQSPGKSTCIICGQEHDQSWKQQRDRTGYEKRAEFTSLLFVLLIVFAIALPAAFIYNSVQPMGRRRQPPEPNAISTLRMLIQSETSFHIEHGRYGSFEELVNAQELCADWVKPIRDGYLYSIYASNEQFLITARHIEY